MHHTGETGLTVQCIQQIVPLETQGQFVGSSFDPFIADTVLQALTVWTQLHHGDASLPTSFEHWQQIKPLRDIGRYTVRVTPIQTRHNITAAHVTLHDSEGDMIAKIENAQHIHHNNLRFEPNGS